MMADTSALLFADFVGILDEIEGAFKPVLILAWAPSFFLEQIEKTLPPQPALQALRERILELLDGKHFSTVSTVTLNEGRASAAGQEHWRQLLAYALREGAVLCSFVPPCDVDLMPAVLTPEEARHFVSCGDLAEAMLTHGFISETECRGAKAQLGTEQIRFSQVFTSFERRTPVILGGGIAELLTRAGLIEPLLTITRIVILEGDILRMRDEVMAWKRRFRITEGLKVLRDRIHTGLRKGIYKTVRYHATIKEEMREPESIEERCLWDLLQAKAVGARFVWCDDRFLSRYGKVGHAPTLGITDILSVLRERKILDDSRYFSCLLRLREANARYIPVTGEEISYYIRRAPISNGAVFETPPLRTLRRYFSACCLDKERMHPPFVADGRQTLGEFEWILNGVRAIAEAIVSQWEGDSAGDCNREARADWLLHNLFVSYLGIFEAQGRTTLIDGGLEGTAYAIGMLFSSGFGLPSPWSQDPCAQPTPRQRFYAWIDSRIFAPAEYVEPRLLERFAEIEVKTMFNCGFRRGCGDTEERVIRAAVVKALLDMPKAIQFRLPLTQETKRWLRLEEPRTVMGVAGHDFDARDVYTAMASACSGRAAKVLSLDKKVVFHFPLRDNKLPSDRLYIRGRDFPEEATVSDFRLPAFVGTDDQQRQFLFSKTHWFDTGAERQNEIVEAILTEVDPARRFERIEQAQKNSAENIFTECFSSAYGIMRL